MAAVSPRRASTLFRRTTTWAGRVAIGIVLLLVSNPAAAAGVVGPGGASHVATGTAGPALDPVGTAERSLSNGGGPAHGQALSCSGTGAIQCDAIPAAAPPPAGRPPPPGAPPPPRPRPPSHAEGGRLPAVYLMATFVLVAGSAFGSLTTRTPLV
jgi:hypothetical protein